MGLRDLLGQFTAVPQSAREVRIPLQWRPLQERLRQQLAQNPGLRFRHSEEVYLASTLGVVIDANQAEVDDWLRLPGISIHQARLLVDLRRGGVQYCALEDVAAVLKMPVAHIEGWEPILAFRYYGLEAEPELPLVQLNPNRASLVELQQVPGIDAALAQEILHQRIMQGRFRDLRDFQRRLHLSGDQLSGLMHYLSL
jgi:DNA uptake protein ComE-like DNA-binding protein